jgi:hypothetical protein
MAENFTTYTLLDSGNDCITVNSATSLSIAGTTNDRYSLHSDKGAAHFSGDFEHIVTTSGSGTGVCAFWGLSNVVDAGNPHDTKVLDDANNTFLYAAWIYSGSLRIYLRECQSGSLAQDLYVSGAGTFYCEIERDEDTGTYGTLLCRIYSDSARTTLVDTLSVTLRAKDDFRTVYGAWSQYTSAGAFSVTVADLDLQESGTIKSYSVADGGDDGGLYNTSLSTSGEILQIGVENEDDVYNVWPSMFFRFTRVAIPAGATIVAASVTLVSAGGRYDYAAGKTGYLKGRKLANCPAMSEAAYKDTVTYPNTTANVAWYPTSTNWVAGTSYTSPELKTVVQEIVDLAGWTSGNAIQIEWHYSGPSQIEVYNGNWRKVYAYEHATYNPPILTVEYTGGATVGNPWWYYRRKRTER